jgi:hypothetical protein
MWMTDVATLPKESAKAYQAFVDYVNLGPKRSLEKLQAQYQTRPEGGPTRQLSKLKEWSAEYDWQERLKHLASSQLEEATNLKTDTYVMIAGEYHRRVSDEPMRKSMQLSALHGIWDRVKPETPQSSGGDGPHITVNFAFVEVTKPQ